MSEAEPASKKHKTIASTLRRTRTIQFFDLQPNIIDEGDYLTLMDLERHFQEQSDELDWEEVTIDEALFHVVHSQHFYPVHTCELDPQHRVTNVHFGE